MEWHAVGSGVSGVTTRTLISGSPISIKQGTKAECLTFPFYKDSLFLAFATDNPKSLVALGNNYLLHSQISELEMWSGLQELIHVSMVHWSRKTSADWLVQHGLSWNGWSLFHRVSHLQGQCMLVHMVAGQSSEESSDVQGTGVHYMYRVTVAAFAQIKGVGKQILPLTEGTLKSHLKECGYRKKNRMIVATLQRICPKFIVLLFHSI